LDDHDPDAPEKDKLLTDIRQSLANGIEHTACDNCWRAEHRNIKSWRQTEGKIPDFLKNKNLDQLPYNQQFTRLEIFFDNTCDLACIYCGPWLSSKWAQENQKTKMFWSKPVDIHKEDDVKIQKIIDTIRTVGKRADATGRVDLAILGGEPFLSPQVKNGKFKRFVDAFYEGAPKSTELLLNFITNCNTPDKIFETNLDYLKQCKEAYPNLIVHISMSLECTGKLTEITRYGSSWEQVDKNIHKWMQQDWIRFNFNTAFNAITLHDVDNYAKYLVNLSKKYSKKISISPNIVYEPNSLLPSIMPSSWSTYIDNAIDTISKNQDCFYDDDAHGWPRFIATLDDIKHTLGNNVDKKPELKFMMQYSKKYRHVNFKKLTPEVFSYVFG
jgi:organic radical activating enzyme